MTLECKKCTMNKECIVLPSSDECFARKQSYNQALDDLAEKIADWCDFCNGGMRKECVKDSKCKIYEIAEQLKK